MGKLRSTTLILGEGETEFYYFQSLRDVFKGLQFSPDRPKNSSLEELEIAIEKGVSAGYAHIFCVIDMDNKDKEPERSKYAKLKAKYANVIDDSKNGIHCEVEFFETHRCTELFFLYYFRYTAPLYSNQEKLLEDLNKDVPYKKSMEYFRKGLHQYFTKKGGELNKAVDNANLSMKTKAADGRSYSYSELGHLIERLRKL